MSKPVITSATILSRLPERQLTTSAIGDEMVLMDLDTGDFISINKIGRLIWEAIAEPMRFEELIQLLTSQFKVSVEDCRADTIKYIESLYTHGLIQIK